MKLAVMVVDTFGTHFKNPAKKPGPKQSNFDVIFHSKKKFFTRLKDVP